MRLLIVTYSFPPAYSACALRWSRIGSELARTGHQVTVVTGTGAPTERRPVDRGTLEVVRVPEAFVSDSRARIQAARDSPGPRSRLAGLRRVALETLRAGWHAVMWPDHAAFWVLPASRAIAEVLDREKTDAVVSVSWPFSSHVATALGLRGTRSSTRPVWVADNGDPFSIPLSRDPNNRRVYRALNRIAEKWVFGTADAVTVPNPGLRDEYRRIWGDAAPDLQVLPHVAGSMTRRQHRPAAGPLRLVFAGSLRAGVRSAQCLVDLWPSLGSVWPQDAPPLSVELLGDLGSEYRRLAALPNSARLTLRLPGRVPESEAIQAMGSATALIDFGNFESFREPSKYADYIVSGLPVVHFPAPGRSVPRMLRDYRRLHVVQSDDPAAAHSLVDFVIRNSGVLPAPLQSDEVALTAGGVTQSLVDMVTGLTTNRREAS